jgi:hypothetical protein
MLVFRCECEQVLGVDDAVNKGKLGECPSCGRIIRVPAGLVDASGKLRFHGTPSRAFEAGPLRELPVRAAPPASKNGQSHANGVEQKPPALPATPVAELIPAVPAAPAPVADAAVEAVTLAPLSSDEVRESEVVEDAAAAVTAMLPTATVPSATTAEPKDTTTSGKAKSVRKGVPFRSTRPQRPGSAKSASVADGEALPAGNDPAAAVETLNAKGMGTLASAAAARRKRADADGSAQPKNKGVLYLIFGAVVLLAVLLGLLYKAGVFGESAPSGPAPAETKKAVSAVTAPSTTPTTTPDTAPSTTPATTPATTPDTTATPEAVKPPEGEKAEKKDAAPVGDKAAETK